MRARMPPISVVIPTFLEEKYVATTLSTLVQIAPHIEIIVVDGESKDKTVEIAKNFTKKVFQICERGISKAKNYGAKHCRGNLVLFLDADVIPPRDFAEKVTETFKDPTVVGATCNIMPVQPRIMETIFFMIHNLMIRVLTWLPHVKVKHSRGEFFAVRRNEFYKIGGFNESIACMEDYDLARRLSRVGRVAFINNLTVYESMRRIRKTGLWKVVWLWSVNFFSYVLRGEPFSKVWQPVR